MYTQAVCKKHLLMVTASMAGLMMPVSAMAVISGLRASGNTAGIMGMAAHVRASRNAAGVMGMTAHVCASRHAAVMIPMPVIRRVGVAVLAVMHVGGCFGTARNTACAVTVFPGQSTAVDAAKAVLVYFRLRTTCHFAGNACSIFLCRPLDFRGTLIYRIGDNTACYHGNGYKRNG